jgi:HEAT repeat protein
MILASVVLLTSSVFAAAPINDPVAKEVVSKLPLRDNSSTPEKITAQLLGLNERQLQEIVDNIDIQGKDKDDKARYALAGLSTVITKDTLPSRKALAAACSNRLAKETEISIKIFLLETVERAGAIESTPAVAACLSDKDQAVVDAAIRTLSTFGGEDSKSALRDALQKSAANRGALLLGLGRLQDDKAVEMIRPMLEEKEARTRISAAVALCEIGDAASVKTINGMLEKADDYDRSQLTAGLLAMARRLVELKKTAEADAIYLSFWENKVQERRHERIAGLEGLITVRGEGALPMVLEAMESPDWQMRAAAVRVGVNAPGEKVTKLFVDQLPKSKNPAEVLAILANRKDPSAFDAVSAMLTNKDEKIQIAAIRAVAATGGEKAIKPLLAIMASGSAPTKAAAVSALSANANKAGDALLAGQLASADSATKVSLLELLAARSATSQQTAIAALLKDSDQKVRLQTLTTLERIGDLSAEEILIPATFVADEKEKEAAEKALVAVARRVPDEVERVKPIIAALPKADAAGKASLIRVLGQTNSKATTDALVGAVKDSNADVQDAAVRALSKSPDPGAMPALLEIAKTGSNDSFKVFGLQGYIRLLEIASVSKEEKLRMYSAAAPLATRPEEKRAIIAGLGKLDSPAALETVSGYLGQDGVQDEAASAACTIAQKLMNQPEAVRPALEKAAASAKSDRVKRQAQEMLNRLPKKKV